MKHGQEESWEKETIEGPLTIIKRGGGVTTYNFVPIQGDGVATNRTLEDTV